MKEIGGYDALNIMFDELNIESCSIYDVNMWRNDYNERFPGVYVDITRDEMLSIPSRYYHWNYKTKRFYKQIHLKCPICGDKHAKYPENEAYQTLEKYYKIDKLHKKSKTTN